MKKFIAFLLVVAAIGLGILHGHYSYLKDKGYTVLYLKGGETLIGKIISEKDDMIEMLTDKGEKIELASSDIASRGGFFDYLGGRFSEAQEAVTAYARKLKEEKIKVEPEDNNDVVEEPRATHNTNRTRKKRETETHVGEVPKPGLDRQKVRQLIDEGKSLYETADYLTGKRNFDAAISELDRVGATDSPDYETATTYSKRCRLFCELTRNIVPNELSDGKNIVRLRFSDGREIIAKFVDKDEDKIRVKQNNGIEATFKLDDEVWEITSVTPAEYNQIQVSEFKKKQKNTARDSYLDLFMVAYMAAQSRLTGYITPILEDVFKLPGSELVVETFYPGEDVDQLVRIMLEAFDREDEIAVLLAASRSERAPSYTSEPPLADVGDTSQRPRDTSDKPSITQVSSDKTGVAGAKEHIRNGQILINKAMTTGGKKRFALGEQAQAELAKARDILTSLRAADPNNQEIGHLLKDTFDLIQLIVHNLRGTR